MNRFVRFFNELLHPQDKCDRIGHKNKTVLKVIRRKTFVNSREVAADYQAEFIVCSRCGFREGPYNEIKMDGYAGCSMPNSYWEEIRNVGYKIID